VLFTEHLFFKKGIGQTDLPGSDGDRQAKVFPLLLILGLT